MEHKALSLGSFCYKGTELDTLAFFSIQHYAFDLFLILIF